MPHFIPPSIHHGLPPTGNLLPSAPLFIISHPSGDIRHSVHLHVTSHPLDSCPHLCDLTDIILACVSRAGVKYILSNTNTNTKMWIFQIQIQISCSTLIQIQLQIQVHRSNTNTFKQIYLPNLFTSKIKHFFKSLDICSWSVSLSLDYTWTWMLPLYFGTFSGFGAVERCCNDGAIYLNDTHEWIKWITSDRFLQTRQNNVHIFGVYYIKHKKSWHIRLNEMILKHLTHIER